MRGEIKDGAETRSGILTLAAAEISENHRKAVGIFRPAAVSKDGLADTADAQPSEMFG